MSARSDALTTLAAMPSAACSTAPVEIPAGGRANVEVQGRVEGCDYGGQSVPLAGPELRMRDEEGEENTQEVALDVRIELIVQGC